MEEFLNALNKFWESHDATYEDTTDGIKIFERDDFPKDYDELEGLIWDKLLTTNWWKIDTKRYLEENGYRCYAGDQDSFGLLVACIEKDGKCMCVG